MLYDYEGNRIRYSAYGGETVSNTFSVRGELTGVSYSPNVIDTAGGYPWPTYALVSDNGTLHTAGDAWDGRTGAILTHLGANYTYDALGRVSGGVSYDAQSRLLTAATAPSCDNPGTRNSIQSGSANYAWGANAHPVTMALSSNRFGVGSSATLHWDGDSLLFADYGSSGGIDLKIGSVADWMSPTANGTFTMIDREFDGGTTSMHNASGYLAWTPSDAYLQHCVVPSPPVSTTPGFTGSDGSTISQPEPGVLYDSVSLIRGTFGYSTMTRGSYVPLPTGNPYRVDLPGTRSIQARRNLLDSTSNGGCPPPKIRGSDGDCVDAIANPASDLFSSLWGLFELIGSWQGGWSSPISQLPNFKLPHVPPKHPCPPQYTEVSGSALLFPTPVGVIGPQGSLASNDGNLYGSVGFAVGSPGFGLSLNNMTAMPYPGNSVTDQISTFSFTGSASAFMNYSVGWNPSGASSGTGFAVGGSSVNGGAVLTFGPFSYSPGACKDG